METDKFVGGVTGNQSSYCKSRRSVRSFVTVKDQGNIGTGHWNWQLEERKFRICVEGENTLTR